MGRTGVRRGQVCENREHVEMRKREKRERTITGIVVPEDWDEHDKVIHVAIKTSDYEEYVVEHNKAGKDLISLVNKKVRVGGAVRQRLNGDLVISVNSHEQIE
jgi:hypothetical protein